MKKHIILLALAATLSPATQADGLNYLTARHAGREKSIELASVRKIVFENGNVVVLTTQGNVTFPAAEMEKLFFSSTATAINDLNDETKNLSFVNGVVKVHGTGVLRVYNLSGTLLRIADVHGGGNVSIENLPQGIYIIKLGNETIKIQK